MNHSANTNDEDLIEDYPYVGLPITPTIIGALAPHVISTSMFRRNELTEAAIEYHTSHGGLAAQTDLSRQVNKALRTMKRKGLVEQTGGYGYWRFRDHTRVSLPSAASVIESTEDEDELAEVEVNADVVEGSGTGLVYVYYYPGYRELAQAKGSDCWRVKIGMSTRSSLDRVTEQQTAALPEEPVVGYVRRTDTPQKLERLIHSILFYRNQQAEDAPGSEWFISSPEEVRSIVHWVMAKARPETQDVISEVN